jgi:hypothetical protein
MALSAQISLSIVAHETSSGDLSRTLRATPASYSLSLTDGTAASLAQVGWSDSRTLSGPTETLALSALPDTRDGASVSVAVTAVKAVYVRAAAPLTFSGAPFPASGVAVAAGGALVQIDPTAAGTAAGTVTVSGSAGASYDIVIVGEGSVS